MSRGILKVVDVGRIVLCAARHAAEELRKLCFELYVRGLRYVQERYLVEHVRQPLAFLLPVEVEANEGVVDGLRTHRHLRREALLREVLQRTAQLEVLREVILPVQAQHRLALHAVVGLALQRHVDVRAGIDETLIEDGNLSGAVVNGVVGALGELCAASRHYHAALRHVVGSKGDDVGRRALELSHKLEAVALRVLLGGGLRLLIEVSEGIARCRALGHALLLHGRDEALAERLCHREEHSAVGHRVALHEVVEAVRVGLVVIV